MLCGLIIWDEDVKGELIDGFYQSPQSGVILQTMLYFEICLIAIWSDPTKFW